ncbi:MAG: type II toxin-antitoxin system VapC family toxin [Solirubrobacterales bacterium]
MIVLDSHAWFWWITEPKKLSPTAARLIDESREIGISSYSALELARARSLGRIALDHPRWIDLAFKHDPRIVEVPMGSKIAQHAIDLIDRGLSGDPGDQVILATAEALRAKLVTKDQRLLEFAPDVAAW